MKRKNFFGYIEELIDARSILFQLVRQQLTLRYRRSIFGYLWTLINPLMMMSVTAVVFSNIFKIDLNTYAVFLFSGMIPFSYFSTAVIQSGQSLTSNEALLKKIYIPKILFPASVSISILIDSILTIVALFLIILAIGGKISVALIFLPFAYLLLFLFTSGVSLAMSISTVYFLDLQHVVGIAMQALLFLTPVFYKTDTMQGKVAWLIALNPLSQFVELFRMPIFVGAFPPLATVASAGALALVSITIGMMFFRKFENHVVFRL